MPLRKAGARKGGRSADARRTLRWLTERPRLSRLLLGLATAAGLAALMVNWSPRAGTAGLTLNDIATHDIRARSTFEVVDKELTEEKRRQARTATPLLFEYDIGLARDVLRRIDEAFGEIRGFLEAAQPARQGGAGDPAPPDQDESDAQASPPDGGAGSNATAAAAADQAASSVSAVLVEEKLDGFEARLGVELRSVDLANLQSVGFSKSVERDVKELVRVAMGDYIVLSGDDLPATGGITVLRVDGSRRSEFPLTDFRAIRDLRGARDRISETAAGDFADRPAHILDTEVYIARALTVPNLRFNASETEVRRELATESVAAVTTTYQRGQTILRSGEPVTPWVLVVLDRMNTETGSYDPLVHHAALTLLLLLVLAAIERFADRFVRGFRRRFNDVLVLALLLLLVGGLARLLEGLGTASAGSAVPVSAYAYLVPVAVGGILLRTLMNAETAAVWAVMAAVVCAIILDGGMLLAVFFLVSVLAGAGGIGKVHERGRLIRAGAVAALANCGLVVAMDFTMLTGMGADVGGGAAAALTDPVFHIIFAVIGGFAGGILAVGLAPLFEGLGFVTESKLLELSNLNHPLLREMIVKAPGTYHHSMMVGSLAESAAEAIGANALILRVGAYFHDIGKTIKPQYFIENQRDIENIHDRLSPSMSALVITAHVKEGIELGRRFKLPQPIIDMIPQHHGTSLVSFFYNKAQQQQDPDKSVEINDSDYRYPGPKPQTKEAAVMMLADGVEAATRSLKNHTPGAIQARVQTIINKCVTDGQLDECPLTLKDLHTVSETFVQVLLGIHHHRIEYPTPDVGKKGRGRGLPATAITLEIPPLTPNPDDPHPLERTLSTDSPDPVDIADSTEAPGAN